MHLSLIMKLNKTRRLQMKKVLMFALALLITAAFVTTGFTQDKPAAAPAPEKAAAAAPEKAKEKAPKAKKAPKEKKEKKEVKKDAEKPAAAPAAPAPAK
jgi:hypothetical protein